jgi:hypothetical protein
MKVVMFTPGEIAAVGYTGYLTNRTITGAYAQAIGGAVIMLEREFTGHSSLKTVPNPDADRYWGDSSPYSYLDTEALQFLTLDQAISDLVYFSKTIDLPFDTNHSSNSQNAVSNSSGSKKIAC